MSLHLDARRRAMLAEMGIGWVPELLAPAETPAATPIEAAAQAAGQPAVDAPPQARPAPRPSVVTDPATAAAPKPVVRVADAGTALDGAGADISGLDWDGLAAAAAACDACELSRSRRNPVLGSGDRHGAWMVVGDGPGEMEDERGDPFSGPKGQLLDNMLRALGLSRTEGGGAFVANAVNCRPPGTRDPEPAEVASCGPFLRRQVELVSPRIILALGRRAVQSLLGLDEPLGRLRGRVHQYQGIPVVVSYPVDYLLRSPADKARAWADLCLARQVLAANQAPVAGRPNAE